MRGLDVRCEIDSLSSNPPVSAALRYTDRQERIIRRAGEIAIVPIAQRVRTG